MCRQEHKSKNLTRLPIAITVLISIVLLTSVACSKKTSRNYRIITQQYIDSLDTVALNQPDDTTDSWQVTSRFERILEGQLPNRYFETLMHYFTDTIANSEIQKFGYILIISRPYAFGDLSSSFKINDKPFYFISPPYYQLNIKSGRHIYFIDHNFHIASNRSLRDSLKITLYDFFPTRKKWEPYYKDKKSGLFSITYISDSLSPRWLKIRMEKIK